MANFTQWKELRELVRKSAIHFELSPESERVALQSALESPVHAYACYQAIERTFDETTCDN
ncbi:hypothetical protein UFOVP501_19 [uncultured Caudovirales phage]|uniref:Uncharacterized protein n=1 Tax=uncultured Caudovirales phage TaxID=2100421 RepID=A0A6J5QR71_9CAUD|nr:hypothetical protein UFOVP501_19 [uncultured Caudovirales phage]CAB4161119.1 hypothetical protein UFOVP762_32 [uncultured Caudovirales phage]CAB4187189.1 hypothetical protein UFOVP1161_19 [uncultured Caudovirales phage]